MKCPDANRVIFLIPTSQITFDLGEYIFCKCFLHNAVKVLLEDLMPMHKFFLLLLCLLLVINIDNNEWLCFSNKLACFMCQC